MVEPTETESKASMDEAIEVFRALARLAHEDPEALHTAPHNTPVRRLDEVQRQETPFCAPRLRNKKKRSPPGCASA